MSEAIVIGTTTEQEVTAASRTEPFVLNSLKQIDSHTVVIGQVVQTFSFNRFLPDGKGMGPVDPQALEALRQLGWDTDGETVHIATIRLLEPQSLPVKVGATVSDPDFDTVAPYYIPKHQERCWSLGIVRGTESMKDVPKSMAERVPIWRRGMAEPVPGAGIPMLFDSWTQADYPHVGIFGGSGSGKSFALRVFCEEMMMAGHPGIILDPHYELEFQRPFDAAGHFKRTFKDRNRVGVVGKDVSIDFTKLSGHVLIELLRSSYDSLSQPMEALTRAIWRPKQDLTTFIDRLHVAKAAHEPSDDPRIDSLLKRHRDIRDAGKSLASLETILALERRINNLIYTGVFGAGRDAVEWVEEGLLARQLCTLRGPMRELQLVGLYVLQTLYEARRDYRDTIERTGSGQKVRPIPPFWVIADEAHGFAPKNPEHPAATKNILRVISQEGRKYGVFLMLATQRVTLLNETITAQLTSKLVMRTVRSQDIETIRNETDISAEEARRLPFLQSGDGYLCLGAQGKSIPVSIRCPYTAGREQAVPWTELDNFSGAPRTTSPDSGDGSETTEAVVSPLAPALLQVIEQRGGQLRRLELGHVEGQISLKLGRNVGLAEMIATLGDLVELGRLVRTGTDMAPTWHLAPEDPPF